MIFFYAEDEAYYTKTAIASLCEQYEHIDEIISMPTEDDIRGIIRKGDPNKAFIATYLPSSLNKIFDKSSIFDIIELANTAGVLTSGQVKAGISVEKALQEKLGINIHKPTVTLADYGGAAVLVEEARRLIIKERYGFPVKGFMLTGIPGTGKTFFAKCLAGETNRLLVELNLSLLMEKENTIFLLNMIFSYFIENQGRYILWIDEIEKMMVGEKAINVLGVLLTRLNDLNSSGDSNIFIIATANNITAIAKNNPEFLRNGRFDLLVFVMPPKEKDALKIFTLYISKARNQFKNEKIMKICASALIGTMESDKTKAFKIQSEFLNKLSELNVDLVSHGADTPEVAEKLIRSNAGASHAVYDVLKGNEFEFEAEEFIRKALVLYRSDTKTGRFIYTPAEIEFIVADVYFSYYFGIDFQANRKDVGEYYADIAQKYRPIQVTLASSIDAMKGVASSFIEI